MTKTTTFITTSAAAAMALATAAIAQDTPTTPELRQTAIDLVRACTDFTSRDGQQQCIDQIAIETHQLYTDYVEGMNGRISPFHFRMVQQELREACDTPLRRNVDIIQSDDLDTAVGAMNDYVGGCLSRQIDAQRGEFESVVGDFSIDMTRVPFDGLRLELIDAFRIVAVGTAIPDHPLRMDNPEDFHAYRSHIAPAFGSTPAAAPAPTNK